MRINEKVYSLSRKLYFANQTKNMATAAAAAVGDLSNIFLMMTNRDENDRSEIASDAEAFVLANNKRVEANNAFDNLRSEATNDPDAAVVNIGEKYFEVYSGAVGQSINKIYSGLDSFMAYRQTVVDDLEKDSATDVPTIIDNGEMITNKLNFLDSLDRVANILADVLGINMDDYAAELENVKKTEAPEIVEEKQPEKPVAIRKINRENTRKK